MKLAITVWNGRIAPLFDVAKQVLIVETEGFGSPVTELTTIELHNDSVAQKIATLAAIGVKALVCGAISREYEEALLDADIELDAYVAGDVTDILEAWQRGMMHQRRYSMPGCQRPRHRCRGRRGQGQGRGQRWNHLRDD